MLQQLEEEVQSQLPEQYKHLLYLPKPIIIQWSSRARALTILRMALCSNHMSAAETHRVSTAVQLLCVACQVLRQEV